MADRLTRHSPVRWITRTAQTGDLVFLRGIASNRAWLRQRGRRSSTDVTLTDEVERLAFPGSPRLQNAFVAAARIITSDDPATRISAISEALEFYAGRTKIDYGFTKSDRRAIRRATQGFSSDKTKRVEDLLGHLNDAPLLGRVRVQCARDGVPISDADMALIKRVRDQRNDLVHGRRLSSDDEDVGRAVAIVARMLLYSAASESQAAPSAPFRGSSGRGPDDRT